MAARRATSSSPSLRRYESDKLIAGCDEAGRGCLAGPVVAGAVILSDDFDHNQLNDSKQLNRHQRDELAAYIVDHALTWGVGLCSPREIETYNILQCSFMAMHRAVEMLEEVPELLLIDGNRFIPLPSIPHICVIKGDSKFQSIAAASIIAKTARDAMMHALDKKHPIYSWRTNKGYPSKAHRAAIAEYGVTEHHRLTFKLIPDDVQMSPQAAQTLLNLQAK